MAYYVGYLPKEHEYFKHPIVRNIHNSTQIKQIFFAALMNITESYCLVEKFEKSSRIYSNMFYKELFKKQRKDYESYVSKMVGEKRVCSLSTTLRSSFGKVSQ